MTRHLSLLGTLAGLLAGPLLWAALMQAGQLLPHAECGAPPPAASAWLTGGGIALSLASALAAAAARRGQAAPRRFLAGLGLMIGLLFAFAMLLQLLATLLVDPCAR